MVLVKRNDNEHILASKPNVQRVFREPETIPLTPEAEPAF